MVDRAVSSTRSRSALPARSVSATVEREPADAPGDDMVAKRQADFIRTLATRAYHVGPALGEWLDGADRNAPSCAQVANFRQGESQVYRPAHGAVFSARAPMRRTSLRTASYPAALSAARLSGFAPR